MGKCVVCVSHRVNKKVRNLKSQQSTREKRSEMMTHIYERGRRRQQKLECDATTTGELGKCEVKVKTENLVNCIGIGHECFLVKKGKMKRRADQDSRNWLCPCWPCLFDLV